MTLSMRRLIRKINAQTSAFERERVALRARQIEQREQWRELVAQLDRLREQLDQLAASA